MFNFFGNIREYKGIDNQGRDAYLVDVPAISAEPIEAYVLTQPGIYAHYQGPTESAPGDTVIIAEIQQVGAVHHFILGMLQQRTLVSRSLERLQVAEAAIDSGTVNKGVHIVDRVMTNVPGSNLQLKTAFKSRELGTLCNELDEVRDPLFKKN